jgi:DNA-binding MarR family transcriptional regulator
MQNLQDLFDDCLFHSSAALARRMARLATEQFQVFDLSYTEGFMLIAVKHAPGITIADLATVLSLDPSTVGKAVERMCLRQLLQREPFGRQVRVFLTGTGEEREADASAAWLKTKVMYRHILGEGRAKQLTGAMVVARKKLALEG